MSKLNAKKSAKNFTRDNAYQTLRTLEVNTPRVLYGLDIRLRRQNVARAAKLIAVVEAFNQALPEIQEMLVDEKSVEIHFAKVAASVAKSKAKRGIETKVETEDETEDDIKF